ncbi:winged helix-turn-helix domain-containing protein [Plebeiibacterium sediminum]|uniref:LysR family transcriptional regulator n=1 Tax=Plebeiibacterium sediminum TaxID=2992112 RepID=A0AAE3M5S4_9BACT|nr:LysR family transcriptional regulator [Plebeiobacterium sediminum]MCW3787422.1 LysR family transcriptional regulator [Plebeiobacterium sediminum]
MTEVELHIHVNKDGKLLVTPERIHLLRLIEETGSLLTASKQVGVSYNKAWKMIDAMNSISSSPVVSKQRGGSGGGGAVVTDFGRLILDEYAVMEKVVSQFTQKFNAEINM